MPRLPVVSGEDAIRAFRRAGWTAERQVGSHVAMEKEGETVTLSVPHHRELDRGLLRRLIREAGITAEQFAALLHK